MTALVAAAADLGVPATPHCYGDEGAKRAVRAGVRSIEHANLASSETLKMIEDAGTFLVPTQYTIVDDARNAFNQDHWTGAPASSRASSRRTSSTAPSGSPAAGSTSPSARTPACSRTATTGASSR
ncbi:hypothetical protein GCM10009735_79100 [Actinomadura chokoriensis]